MLDKLDFEYIEAAIGAAANTDADSDIVDMAGFEGALFITPIVDSVATGVAALTIEGDDANAAGGMVALTGAVATKTCVDVDDLNGQYLIVDVKKPIYRYLRANITSTVANIAFGATTVIKYGPRKQPVTHTDVLHGVEVVGPAQSA